MADFTEIWDLRNRLVLDGLYPQEADPVDPLELERKIMRLAAQHYGWTAPEPHSGLYEYKDYRIEDALACMTPMERIDDVLGILIDWDGYRSCRGLGALIDEVRARLAYPEFLSEDILEKEFEYWQHNTIEDLINNNETFMQDIEDTKDGSGSYFIDIYSMRDWPTLHQWCKEEELHAEIITIHADYNLISVRISKNELI